MTASNWFADFGRSGHRPRDSTSHVAALDAELREPFRVAQGVDRDDPSARDRNAIIDTTLPPTLTTTPGLAVDESRCE
jgi:hypothetical protein